VPAPVEQFESRSLLVPDARGELVRIAHPYERPFLRRADRPRSQGC
jgi:hypothetical protein